MIDPQVDEAVGYMLRLWNERFRKDAFRDEFDCLSHIFLLYFAQTLWSAFWILSLSN
ncbi:hypothetical protein ACJX0J_036782, partial [Zea mays]